MKTITLAHPIEIEGREPLSTIVLRRPRLKDVEAMNRAMRAAGSGTAELIAATDAASMAVASGAPAAMPAPNADAAIAGGIALLASMNNVSADIIREMDVEDFAAMQDDLAGFFQQVRPSNPAA